MTELNSALKQHQHFNEKWMDSHESSSTTASPQEQILTHVFSSFYKPFPVVGSKAQAVGVEHLTRLLPVSLTVTEGAC